MIHLAIVEDSAPSANKIKDYIRRFVDSVSSEGRYDETDFRISVYGNGNSFLTAVLSRCFDIVFLDIGLPDIDGMTIAEELRKNNRNVMIVFVTDMAQFAVKGYRVDALDYLVKPVAYYNFSVVMERALSRLDRSALAPSVVVKTESSVIRLPADDIKYIEVVAHRLIYHTKNGEITGYGQLKNLEELLSDSGFIACSRYYLVNLKYIRSVKDFTLDVDGTPLQVSVRKRKEVLLKVAEFFCE